jgi:hypothetical protein
MSSVAHVSIANVLQRFDEKFKITGESFLFTERPLHLTVYPGGIHKPGFNKTRCMPLSIAGGAGFAAQTITKTSFPQAHRCVSVQH